MRERGKHSRDRWCQVVKVIYGAYEVSWLRCCSAIFLVPVTIRMQMLNGTRARKIGNGNTPLTVHFLLRNHALSCENVVRSSKPWDMSDVRGDHLAFVHRGSLSIGWVRNIWSGWVSPSRSALKLLSRAYVFRCATPNYDSETLVAIASKVFHRKIDSCGCRTPFRFGRTSELFLSEHIQAVCNWKFYFHDAKTLGRPMFECCKVLSIPEIAAISDVSQAGPWVFAISLRSSSLSFKKPYVNTTIRVFK